jgi:hypothetical protein
LATSQILLQVGDGYTDIRLLVINAIESVLLKQPGNIIVMSLTHNDITPDVQKD